MRVIAEDESLECQPMWEETTIRIISRGGAAEYHRQIRVTHALLPLALAAIEEPERFVVDQVSGGHDGGCDGKGIDPADAAGHRK